MKIKMLQDFRGVETGEHLWYAGEEREVSPAAAEHLIRHRQAEPVDAPAKELKTKHDEAAKKAAAESETQAEREAEASRFAAASKAAELHRQEHTAAVATLSSELRSKDDARLVAERKAHFDAEAEAIVTKAENAAAAEAEKARKAEAAARAEAARAPLYVMHAPQRADESDAQYANRREAERQAEHKPGFLAALGHPGEPDSEHAARLEADAEFKAGQAERKAEAKSSKAK